MVPVPTINISGKGPGAGGPKDVRGPAWEAYQKAKDAASAGESRRDRDVGTAYAAQQKEIQRQTTAAYNARSRMERADRVDERRLLREEMQSAEAIARIRRTQEKEAQRTQTIIDRSERGADLRKHRAWHETRRTADYENREFNARDRKQQRGYADARSAANYENREYDLRARKQKREGDSNYRVSRAEAEAINRRQDRAYQPIGNGIYAIGAGGQNAIRSHDPLRTMAAKIQLAAVSRNAQRRLADGASGEEAVRLQKVIADVGHAREGMAAERYGVGLEGPLMMAGPYGEAAAAALMAIKVGKGLWNASGAAVSKAHGLVDASRPYTDILRGASDIGGAGGFNGDALSNRLTRLDKNGQVPAWRKRYGVTADDAMGMINAYGVAPRSAKEAESIAKDAAGANMAPYLQGLGNNRLAAMAGNYGSLTGSSGESRMDYYRHLQRVMQVAVTYGVDRTKMAGILERVQGQTAGAGGAVSMAASADYINRMMSTGNSGVRSGAGIMGLQSSLSSGISGLGLGGGNQLGNMAISAAVAKQGGVKTKDQLEKFIGRKREDMSASDQKLFDDALAEGQHGSAITFSHTVGPLLQSDEGKAAYYGMVHSYTGSMGLRGSLQNAADSAITGATMSETAAATTSGYGTAKPGSGYTKGGMGWADLGADLGGNIASASDQVNPTRNGRGVTPALLAGLIQYESSGGKRMHSGTGANGYGQITKTTFDAYQKQGKLQGFKYEDVYDPILGPQITAQILNEEIGRAHGDVRQGLKNYHGPQTDKNGVGPDQYADGVFGAESTYDNNQPGLRASDANVGQADVNDARKNYVASKPLGGAAGDDLVSATSKFSDAVNDFVQGITDFVSGLSSGSGSSSSSTAPANNHPGGAHGRYVPTP